jgi:AcrR family transcriptional regulator
MQTSPSPVGPLRRVPVQGRSLARVHRMLDACAELDDEVGYEGLTTTLLAERASVAIGSVYQFFPDKRAIVQALAMRNVDAYVARVSTRIKDGSLTDWADAVDVAMDEYIDMLSSSVACSCTASAWPTAPCCGCPCRSPWNWATRW